MGSRELAVLGLELRAVSARVTKHFVTILVKHVIMKTIYCYFNLRENFCLLRAWCIRYCYYGHN